jgi:hypothetical protein
MADQTLEDVSAQLEEPACDPELPPSKEATERYFETLKRFLSDAKNLKTLGLHGAKEFWEQAHLEELSSAIESVEKIVNPLEKAAKLGKAIGEAAWSCKPALADFLGPRSANAVSGQGHANPDFAGASVHALISPDWAMNKVNNWVANLSMNDVKHAVVKPLLCFRYKFRQHEYLGCAEEALKYFVRAKSYYDML